MNQIIFIAVILLGSIAFSIVLFLKWKKKSFAPPATTTQEASQIVQAFIRHGAFEVKEEHINALTEAILALMEARKNKYIADEEIEQALQQLKTGQPEQGKKIFIRILDNIAAQGHITHKATAAATRHWGTLAALTDTVEAFKAFRRAVKLDPDHPEGWLQLGHLLKHIGELEKAQEAYHKVRQWGETHVNNEYQAIAYNNLGILYWIADDSAQAEQMHLKSLEINQKLERQESIAKQYNNLGILYRSRGDWQQAEHMYLKSLEIYQQLDNKEGIATQYGNLGNLYSTQGDCSRAEKMFLKSLEIDKFLAKQSSRNDLQKAENMYLKSLEVSEDIRCKARMASDYSNLGIVYEDQGNLQQAEAMHLKSLEIETALAHQEGMAVEYSNLGLVYHTRGDLDKAEAMYQKSLEIERQQDNQEGMANQYGNLGILYTTRGDWQQAEAMFLKSLAIEKALDRKEDMAHQYTNLGNIFRKQGNLRQTQEMYRKSLELYQLLDHPNADLVEQWLTKVKMHKGS